MVLGDLVSSLVITKKKKTRKRNRANNPPKIRKLHPKKNFTNRGRLMELRQQLNNFYEQQVEETGPERNGIAHLARQHALEDYKSRRGFNVECTGSAYEGTYVGNDYDFDAIVVVTTPNGMLKKADVERTYLTQGNFSVFELNPSYQSSQVPDVFNRFTSTKRLLAPEMRREFQQSVNQSLGVRGKQFSYNGFTFLVKREDKEDNTLLTVTQLGGNQYDEFTMDLTLAIRFEGENYIAIPINHGSPGDWSSGIWWKKDVAQREARSLSTIDRGNLISKKVLRIYKAICKQNPELEDIPRCSYAAKTCLQRLREYSHYGWSDDQLASRFIDFLYEIYKMLFSENVPEFYFPNVNVVASDKLTGRTGALFLESKFRIGYRGFRELLGIYV